MAGTGNPIGSTTFADFEYNVGVAVDNWTNSTADTVLLRTINGVQREVPSLQGNNNLAAQSISKIKNDGADAIQALRIETPFTFTEGGTLTAPNQVVLYTTDGRHYRWDGSFPKTVTAGTDPTTDSTWVDVGQAALRSEITGFGATTQEVGGAALKTTSTYNKRTQNKAVVSFIFDDGLSNAIPVIESVFDARGITCGLAIIATQAGVEANRAKLDDLILLQDKGYEILSHSLTEQSVDAASSPRESLVRSELNNSFDILSEGGFNIKGFVTTASELDPTKRFVAFEKYSYAFTIYKGDTGGIGALQDSNLVLNQLFRTNLFSVGLTEAKNIVDLAIANGGYVQFYDHDPTQTQFVNSMSQADLEELLDYCQAQGVEVLNPRDAIDQVHSASMKGVNTLLSDKQNSTDNAQHRRNVIQDTKFEDIGFGALDTYIWTALDQNSATGSATIGVNDRGRYGEAVITADSSHTANTGSIALINRRSVFYSTDMPRRLNFSCKLRSTTSGYRNLYDTTIEVNTYRLSDDALLDSVTTEALWVDSVFRRYDVSISPTSTTEFYVECIVRMSPLTTGDSALLVVSKPALIESDKMEPWSEGISIDELFTATGTYPQLAATSLPTSTYTRVGIANPVNGTDFQTNADGTIDIKTKGTYLFVTNVQITDAAITDGDRLMLSARINVTGDYLQRTNFYASSGGGIQASMTFCRHLDAGDIVDFYAWQNSGSTVSVESSSLSSVNITRLR